MDQSTWQSVMSIGWEEAIEAVNSFTMDSSKPNEDPFPDLTQALDTLAVNPTETQAFDNVGVNPENLIGKDIATFLLTETHTLAFQLTDGSQVLLREKADPKRGNSYLHQPKEIFVDSALGNALKFFQTPLRIKDAAIGKRRATDPGRENDIGHYEYRVVGFLIDGMDEMGWIGCHAPAQTSGWGCYVDLIMYS